MGSWLGPARVGRRLAPASAKGRRYSSCSSGVSVAQDGAGEKGFDEEIILEDDFVSFG